MKCSTTYEVAPCVQAGAVCVCLCLPVLQMQVSASASSEAVTELYHQSRQLRVLFQRIDQMEVRLCTAGCGVASPGATWYRHMRMCISLHWDALEYMPLFVHCECVPVHI